MSPEKNEIFNELWKFQFKTAHILTEKYPTALTEDESELIDALFNQFGNIGLFSGTVRVIIDNALSNIGVYDTDTNNEQPTLYLVSSDKK